MSYPFGETVYRDRPPQIPDPYKSGHTVPGEYEDGTTITLPGAFVGSSSSTNASDATREQILSAKSLYCPPASDVQVGDRIRTASGTWYVNELPTADINPFTGWQPVREVPLNGTLGGEEHAMAVEFNNAFFDDLSRSPGVVALVDEATERIANTARSTAPVGETGEYRDGIATAGKYQRRYVGLVIGTDKKTMLVESRTGNLARALRANRRGSRSA